MTQFYHVRYTVVKFLLLCFVLSSCQSKGEDIDWVNQMIVKRDLSGNPIVAPTPYIYPKRIVSSEAGIP